MKKKLLISAGIAALLGGMYFASGYAVRPIANHYIRLNGFPEARISDMSLTPTGLMIDHISLDGNDFSTVDNVNIAVNWSDFIKTGKIESLTIKDISLICELDEDGHLKIAGWDATLPTSDSSSALIPIQSLLLQGITLDIETPQGDIRVEGKISIDTPSPDKQTLQYAVWGQQHQLSFDAKGTGTLSSNGDLSLSTTLNDGRVNLENIELSRASGWVDYHRPVGGAVSTYSGQFVAGKVNTLGALLQNVTVTLDTSKAESLFFKTSPAGHNDISFTGRWMTLPQNQLELIVASKSSIELVELLAPEKVDDYKGWLKNANPLALTLSAPLTALQDKIKTADFHLQLGADKSDVILNSAGQVSYDSESEKTAFQIAQTHIKIAGGTVDASPFAFASDYTGSPPLNLSLTLKDIDMAELAKLADVDGLTATGTLSGSVPLVYSDKGLIFGEGSVKSNGKGVFSYTPQSFPSSLQGDDTRMKTVREALSDFHFTSFSAEVSGPFSGKMKTTLRAEGTNPVFGDRPINLNLNLDGDLGSVIQQTLQAGDIGSKIGSQISGAKKQ